MNVNIYQQINIETGEVINTGDVNTFLPLGFDSSSILKVANGEYSNHRGFLFRKYEPYPDKKYIMAIDSGKRGAIVLIDIKSKEIAFKFTIPLDNNGNYDLDRISNYIKNHSDYIELCGIEIIHSMYGTTKHTAFEMGYGYGILVGILESNNIKYIEIKPTEWQNYSRTNEDIVFKNELTKTGKKKIDTKKTALNVAGRLFPNESFLATKRSHVKHDGIIDATLIAYYTLNKFI